MAATTNSPIPCSLSTSASKFTCLVLNKSCLAIVRSEMNTSATRTFSDRGSSPGLSGTDGEAGSYKRRKIDPGPSPLCNDCRLLDLDVEFDTAGQTYQARRGKTRVEQDKLNLAPDGSYFYTGAVVVHQFQNRLSQPSDCPLCTFFRSLRTQPGRHDRYKLLAFPSSESWLFRLDGLQDMDNWDEVEDTIFMTVVPDDASMPLSGHGEHWLEQDVPATGAIYLQRAGDLPRTVDSTALLRARELGADADLGLVELWLRVCQKEHGKACERPNLHEPITRGFRVIDCHSEPLVVEEKDWGETYAALSYVWGTSPEDLEEWPKTVRDAVTVTKELGVRYLWVDRLCINQSDPDEKANLISRMTTIYEEASFTIVAAAGSGASFGLPGVGSTPRKPQPKYVLDSGNTLLSMLPDPRRDILEAEYWKRGWTYQEGVLSNRRIVFTENQVYWECRCMATHESVEMTLFHMTSPDDEDSNTRMADFMLTGIFKGDAFSGGSLSDHDDLLISGDEHQLYYGFPAHREASIRSQLRGIDEHIREYSKRRLGVETDTLPAFQGIMGLYSHNKSIFLIHGMPMWLGDGIGNRTAAEVTFALSVSSWYHRSGQEHQMFVAEPCRRKLHLPSWTWAGWQGTVTWRAPPEHEHSTLMTNLIAARNLSLLWAADICLCNPQQGSFRLRDTHSAENLDKFGPKLLMVRKPLVLKYFNRKEKIEKWGWHRMAGRPGRERQRVNPPDWDYKWSRIAGRLCCTGLSVSMTPEEWTAKHSSGELVSVLMYAAKDPHIEHGSARFLTLRRVNSLHTLKTTTKRWERVGVLYLTIPFLKKCETNEKFLNQIPVQLVDTTIVIQ